MALALVRVSIRRPTSIRVDAKNHQNAWSSVMGRRAFVTSVTVRSTESFEHLPTNLRLRNVLYSTSQLFSPGSPLASPTWLGRTETAAARLADAARHLNTSRTLRIGVVGDAQSGTQLLIETLLDDPMAQFGQSEQDKVEKALEALRTRRATRSSNMPSTLLVQYGTETSAAEEGIHVPLAKLRDNQIEFVEVINPTEESAVQDALYACDKIIFVADEFTLAAHHRFGRDLRTPRSLKLLQVFAQKPGTTLVINHGEQTLFASQVLEQGLQNAVSGTPYAHLTSKDLEENAPRIIRASVKQAQKANQAVRDALAEAEHTAPSAAAWDRFTALFASSGLGDVQLLVSKPGASCSTVQDDVEKDALRTSIFVLRRALDRIMTSLERDLDHIRKAREAADLLRQEVTAERERMLHRLFASSSARHYGTEALHKRTGDRSPSLDASSKDAWSIVETTFANRLPWWKVLWRVDDVRAEAEAAIARGFAKRLEQDLTVQTGRLVSVAERLHRRVRALFHTIDEAQARRADEGGPGMEALSTRDPFTSAVLLNELRKYPVDKIEAELTADVLVQPIERRRDQLVQPGGPLDMLCTRAQKSTLTSIGTIGSTGILTLCSGLAGSTTFSSAMPLAFNVLAMQPSTAAATFGFVSVAALWTMQSRWTRAKRRFWRDWERVVSGLDRDLEANVVRVFDEKVAVQSLVAAQGLDQKASQYIGEVEAAQATVQEILQDLPRQAAKSN